MPDGALALPTRLLAKLGERPAAALTGLVALVLSAYVLGYPLALVTYPPIIDLPFHAAQTSILAHYSDPGWHFHEQFTVHPLEMPYVSMYAIGAALSLVLPIHLAAKGMVLAMLALLPAGLAVLSWGMKKSPALGLLGLALAWNTLTHWGFLNFLGAIGLMAMAVGLALRVVDDPTRGRRIALAATLVVLFFTHVYRVPFAVLGVVGAGGIVYPVTRRLRPLFVPLLPVLFLFGLWFLMRDPGLAGSGPSLDFDLTRFTELRRHLFGAYTPPEGAPPNPLSEREISIFWQVLAAVVVAGASCAFFGRLERRPQGATTADRWLTFVRWVPILLTAGMLAAYVTLPFEIGKWFYVYPRESVTAAYFLLAAIPDLPRRLVGRAVTLSLIAFASGRPAQFVATEYQRFERLTEDFREIAAEVPRAPKLFYLVYDLGGTLRRVSPVMHLPAWIQAEKGGWLNFHFVRWNHSLIRYRPDGRAVPPELPDRFEWTPQHFRMAVHGAWFDTFLVRHTLDPSVLFGSDPRVHLVTRRGTWWLYRRSE